MSAVNSFRAVQSWMPRPDRADHVLDGVLRDAGKARNIDDVGNPVNVLKPGNSRLVLPAGQAHAAVHIPHPVSGEGSALEHGEHDLVHLPHLHLIHAEGAGTVGGILHVPVHLLLRHELVKTGVREEIQPIPAPGLDADAAGLRAGEHPRWGGRPHRSSRSSL